MYTFTYLTLFTFKLEPTEVKMLRKSQILSFSKLSLSINEDDNSYKSHLTLEHH